MTVAIYIRVSTEEQAKDGFSISAQREKLKAYCKVHDWTEYKFYVDEGISAKDTDRPQLKKMLKHIEDEKIKTVLVYKLDRLTRSVRDLYKLLETFEKYNCTFKSATEIYDTGSAMGRLFMTLAAAMAQWERENLGERVTMGQIEKARQGEYAAKAPYGFNKDENDRLIVNEEEKKIIMLMIEKIYEGKSIRQVGKYLDSTGVPTIRGYKWHIRTILDTLSNHALYGAVYWKGEIYKNSHEPILTKEDYDQLQKVISSRRNYKIRETTADHIFQMKLQCNGCSSRLVSERSWYFRKRDNQNVYANRYRCGMCADEGRKSQSVSELQMEKAFVKFMKDLEFDEVPKVETNRKDEYQELSEQILKIERQREKYQKAWSMDLMTDQEFTDRMNETKGVYEELKNKLNSIVPQKEDNQDPEKIKLIAKNFKKNWIHLTQLEKREFVQTFVEKIEYRKDGIAAIVEEVVFY